MATCARRLRCKNKYVTVLTVAICFVLCYFFILVNQTSDYSQHLIKMNEEEDVEDVRTTKVHLLQKAVKELLARWKESPLRKKPKKVPVCERYEREGREAKVHVTNVWKDNVKDKQLTLVTQLAVKKLDVMERLLQHWTGPVSFALYCDEKSLPKLDKMLMSTNSSLLLRRDIVLHLVYQSGEFYPVNFLRNLALNNTDFKYVLLSDVDFIPSYGSYEYILGLLKGGKLHRKQAFVVPAFEFPNKTLVVEYPRSKQELMQLCLNNTVKPFHWKFTPGHGPTNIKKWMKSNETYRAKFADGYEPYIVIDKAEVPPYPQQFVGRLGNKIAHLLHVHYIGYEFVVLPDAFLIHYPHHVNWAIGHFGCANIAIHAFKAKMKELYPDMPSADH